MLRYIINVLKVALISLIAMSISSCILTKKNKNCDAYSYKNKVINRKNAGLKVRDYEYHSPDIERYYKMNCLLYGMKPQSFVRLKKMLNEQSIGAERCISYYKSRNVYWSSLLSPYSKYGYFE